MKEKVMSKGEAKLLIVASAAHQLTEYHRHFVVVVELRV